MAPEQAEGKSKDSGPPVDVYSLGAILYECLTGRPPFRGITALETLQQVRSREPVPVRQLQPGVPRDLETICLKCLHKGSAQRYASALDLAEDLRRFLEGRPIRARRTGPAGRLWLWCRRNPVATCLVATLLLGTVLSSCLAVWASRERHRADIKAAEAQRNLRTARQAIHTHFVRISEAEQWNGPGIRELRKQLQADAVKFFTQLAQQHQDDPEIQADVADAHFRLGVLTDQVGSRQEARQHYEQARQGFERLLESDFDLDQARDRLARACFHLGIVEAALGDLAGGLRSHQRALDLRRQLAGASQEPALQVDVAQTYASIANLQARQDLAPQALASYRQALAIQEKVVRDHPRPKWRSMLGTIWSNLGALLKDQPGQVQAAQDAYEKALAIRKELLATNPKAADYLSDLASVWNNLGVLHMKTGKTAEALRALRHALNVREPLAGALPDVPIARVHLAQTYTNLGILHAKLGQYPEALGRMQQALEVRARLAKEHPGVVEWQQSCAASHYNVAEVYREMGKPVEALAPAQRARDLRKQLVEKYPGDHLLKRDLSASEDQVRLLQSRP
jgi:serine/threonine-protein kinase